MNQSEFKPQPHLKVSYLNSILSMNHVIVLSIRSIVLLQRKSHADSPRTNDELGSRRQHTPRRMRWCLCVCPDQQAHNHSPALYFSLGFTRCKPCAIASPSLLIVARVFMFHSVSIFALGSSPPYLTIGVP